MSWVSMIIGRWISGDKFRDHIVWGKSFSSLRGKMFVAGGEDMSKEDEVGITFGSRLRFKEDVLWGLPMKTWKSWKLLLKDFWPNKIVLFEFKNENKCKIICKNKR